MKAVDIAKQLKISKATVSLALNNKPGVSEATRKRILEYAHTMENMEAQPDTLLSRLPEAVRNIIRVVVLSKGLNLVQSQELDILPDFTIFLERAARQLGYTLEVSYPDMQTRSISDIVAECNASPAKGIILFASELTGEEIGGFRGIKKPVVLYDNISAPGIYSSVTIDNRGASRAAVDYLVSRGFKDIGYLAMTRSIFNYQERRKGFLEAMADHNLHCTGKSIMHIGEKIDDIYEKIKNNWNIINTHEAYIMESYHLSVGVLHAFRDLGIHVPKDTSLIGIDQLPSYLMGDCQLTTIKVPHENRASLAVLLLNSEINSQEPFKSTLVTNCILTEGNSVKRIK